MRRGVGTLFWLVAFLRTGRLYSTTPSSRPLSLAMKRLLAAVLCWTLLPAAIPAQVPPEKAEATFTVHDPQLEWKLWASEPMFANPTSMDIDHLGRVWVCESV